MAGFIMCIGIEKNWYQPMVFYPEHHSELEKTFLGTTIPANNIGARKL